MVLGPRDVGDTTWYRERLGTPGPILWRAWVAPGRRNARKGVGHFGGLRYVLIPGDNPASATRPDKSKCRRALRRGGLVEML